MSEKPFWWPDARGWLSIAMFSLTIGILLMLKYDATLAKDEFFKVLASAIVVTGLLNNVTGYYFTSSKTNSDLRDQVGKALNVAEAATVAAETPQPVEVVNTVQNPAIVTETPAVAPEASVEDTRPDYAR